MAAATTVSHITTTRQHAALHHYWTLEAAGDNDPPVFRNICDKDPWNWVKIIVVNAVGGQMGSKSGLMTPNKSLESLHFLL